MLFRGAASRARRGATRGDRDRRGPLGHRHYAGVMALTPMLAELTTLRVGGPIGTRSLDRPRSDIIDAVRDADDPERPLLVLGGGSNVVCSDDGFAGVVVRDRREEVAVQRRRVRRGHRDGRGGHAVGPRRRARGGRGLGRDRGPIGHSGSVGATPVQNVGAYGQEVADVRGSGPHVGPGRELRVRTFAGAECGFGYRDSLLKRTMRARLRTASGGIRHRGSLFSRSPSS